MGSLQTNYMVVPQFEQKNFVMNIGTQRHLFPLSDWFHQILKSIGTWSDLLYYEWDAKKGWNF